MSALKLHTLKQKLWAIVAASFVARVVIFFVLPNTPSSLAPDEGTYAALTKWIGESKSANEFPLYGQGLYHSGRSLIVPSSILYRAGFDELDAVRLVASVYGFCTLVIVILITLKFYSQSAPSGTYQTRNHYFITTMILVFAFLPSHFIWSILGLRESSTEFWLIIAFTTIYLIFYQYKKITIFSLIALIGSIVMTFNSRPQVGWVLGVTLIIYLIFNMRQTVTYFLLPLTIFAIAIGSALSLGTTVSTVSTENTLESVFSPLLNAGEAVIAKQEGNQLSAASAIKTMSCPREMPNLRSSVPTKLDAYFCIAWRAPYMVSTFLFRPILSLDVTSTSSLIAALENVFWLALFMTLFVLLVKRRAISFGKPLLPSIIFLILYVLGASAYQGNMGTGFRHKSLILWATLLVISALAWRKPEEVPKKPRNNSQESAV